MRTSWAGAIGLVIALAFGMVYGAGAQGTGFNFKLWETPRPVADLVFVGADGRQFSLNAFRGKTVLLNVWATWCPPCRKEMPALERLQRALGGPSFQVIALSIDSGGLGDVQAFYRKLGLDERGIFLDQEGSAMRDLKIIGLPTTLLIDDQGREIGRKQGPAAWNSPEVVAFLQTHVGTENSNP